MASHIEAYFNDQRLRQANKSYSEVDSARQDPVFKVNERESKQSARQNPVFRSKESMYQKESKQSARKDPVFKTKERESKQFARRNPDLGPKKVCIRRNSKEMQEKIHISLNVRELRSNK